MPLQTSATGHPMPGEKRCEEEERTLIIAKFSDCKSDEPEVVQGLSTIKEVFTFFKPKITYHQETEEGTLIESISFQKINHFGRNGLVRRSALLNDLALQKGEYQNIVLQLKSNKALIEVFNDAAYKQHLMRAFRAAIQLLEDANTLLLDEPATWKREGLDVENSPGLDVLLRVAIQGLSSVGGYDLIESTSIKGLKNLSPVRNAARKRLFLEDSANKKHRENLKKRLQIWVDALTTSDDLTVVIERCYPQLNTAERLLERNMKQVLLQTNEMEKAYRLLSLVFRYDYNDKKKYVSFINVDPKHLGCRYITGLIQRVISQNRDSISRVTNHKLIIVPSYPGSIEEVQRWKTLLWDNNVHLITDVEGVGGPDDILKVLENELNEWREKQ